MHWIENRGAFPMRTIALGPITRSASWGWVGHDMGPELLKYFRVEFFEEAPPPCDVAIVVKWPLSSAAARASRERGTRLVYCPVDYYRSTDEIRASAPFLSCCSAVLIHCERLRPHLSEFTKS